MSEMIKEHYTKYPLTIKLRNVKNEDGKYKMIPAKKWTARDKTCQPIKSYLENRRMIDNSKSADNKRGVGMVLERLFIIDLDVGHTKDQNGKRTFGEWIKKHDEKTCNQIMLDIANTMRVVTPSGGVHIYFSLPKNQASFTGNRSVGAMEGVDLLTGKNSYVPAPNTERGDGMYQLHHKSDEYILQAPSWVLELFEKASSSGNYSTKSNNKGITKKKTATQIWNEEFINGYGLYDKYLNRMAKGFKKGERNENMASLCVMLRNDIKRKAITKPNALLVVDITNKNSQPPMEDDELMTIWDSVVEKYFEKWGRHI